MQQRCSLYNFQISALSICDSRRYAIDTQDMVKIMDWICILVPASRFFDGEFLHLREQSFYANLLKGYIKNSEKVPCNDNYRQNDQGGPHKLPCEPDHKSQNKYPYKQNQACCNNCENVIYYFAHH
jgi:hypothetical protein